jgi:hypothetical protein
MPTLWMLRLEDGKFQFSQGYIAKPVFISLTLVSYGN